jgi:hypothetical protein
LTVRTLFNAVVAQYDYDNMEGREVSHSMLTILHVFFTNIILMNYLIAILSSTYEKMRQSGVFSFKVNLYQYCERYLIAFNDRDYGEIVLHAPPLSYIWSILLPFMWSRTVVAALTKVISYLMFWIENIVFIAFFILLEFALMPIAYFKIWFNIITNSSSILIMFTNSVFYAFAGFGIMFWVLLKDIAYLIKILAYHEVRIV